MRDLLKRISALFSVPPEAVGVFRLELVGNDLVSLENHKGILSYSDTEVTLHGGDCILNILGKHLTLSAMTDTELLLRGDVSQINLTAVSEAKR